MENTKIIAESKLPIMDGDASIAAIVALANKAQGFQLVNLETRGLGVGLPAHVPLLVDLKGDRAVVSPLKNVIETYRIDPEQRVGKAIVTTLQSFCDLVNRHKDEGSVLFAQTAWPKPKLTAVIDYHATDHTPRHGKHRIEYAFPVTVELAKWIEMNGKPMEQADFAAFLEEHAAELSAPVHEELATYEPLFKEKFAAPNDLIALSRSLEIFVGARVKRAERLSSGERIVEFVEEHTNGQGEKIDIPGIFMISVQAFVDGLFIRIPARLRYRAHGGSIKWFYQLYRWDFSLRNQVKTDLDCAMKSTALPAYEGEPEA